MLQCDTVLTVTTRALHRRFFIYANAMSIRKNPILRLLAMAVLASIPTHLAATDITKLKVRNKVRLSASAGVCQGRVSTVTPETLTVRLTKTSPTCGPKDTNLVIPAAQVAAIDFQRHSVFHHAVKGALVGAGCLALGYVTAAGVGLATESGRASFAAGAGVCALILSLSYWPESRMVALSCSNPQHCVSQNSAGL
jgi:hypothetical protein